MAKVLIKKGTTSKLIEVFIADSSSTTGAGLTGLVFNSAGLSAYSYRSGAASAVAITLVTMTLGTWASGGFIAIDGTNMPGWYQVGLPDAALATGANQVAVHLKGATNMAPLPLEIQLVDFDPTDAAGLGLSRLDAAITSRLAPTVAARTLNVSAAGVADANVTTWLTAAVNALIAGRVDANAQVVGDKTGYALTTAEEDAIVNKVWDELTAEARTAGSYGQLVKDDLNATVASRSSHSAADVWASATRRLTSIEAADLVAAAANKLADHVLRRTYANARTSADGDAVNFRSLLGAVGKLVNKWSISGTTLTVTQEDDLTSTAPGGTQTVTATAGADPITALDTV